MVPQGIRISESNDQGPRNVVRCEVCLTEVPLSVANSAEGLDYVHHFCGLNCLLKWQAQGRPNAMRDKK